MTDEELNELSRKHKIRGRLMNAACGLVRTAEDDPVILSSFLRLVRAFVSCTERELQQQIDYLVSCNYLEAVKKQAAPRDEPRIIGYRPTVKGIQLKEGDLRDDTIEFSHF